MCRGQDANGDGHDEPNSVLARLCDVHCHPIDAPDFQHAKSRAGELAIGEACCMSSFIGSFELTVELVDYLGPDKMTPAFGIHPWFCHGLATDPNGLDKRRHYEALFPGEDGGRHPDLTGALLDALPSPRPLAEILSSLEQHLARYPNAVVGEIGLDRSFRIPRLDLTPSQSSSSHSSAPSSTPKRLTSLKTPVSHQLAICEAQLDVAVKLGRNVSFHAVQAQGELEALLKRLEEKWGSRFTGPRPVKRRRTKTLAVEEDEHRGIHLDVHSPLVSSQTLESLHKRYPSTLYFSFSTTICGRSPRLDSLIRSTPDDRLLIESDWNGPEGMDAAVWDVFKRVCAVKKWTTEEAVDRLAENWRSFMWR